jgi:hypothetical protein
MLSRGSYVMQSVDTETHKCSHTFQYKQSLGGVTIEALVAGVQTNQANLSSSTRHKPWRR